MTLPTPEILALTLVFAGIGYVQNEYILPKHAIAKQDTFRVYKYPTENKYFCPSYCAVDHYHFVHLKDDCTKNKCYHMVIDTVERYMSREEYTKRNDSKRRPSHSPIIRPSP